MVCIQLKDKHGFLTSQSCRSSMLHYDSNLVHIAKLIVFCPLFIFGAKEEKQTLHFELYNDFEEDQVISYRHFKLISSNKNIERNVLENLVFLCCVVSSCD